MIRVGTFVSRRVLCIGADGGPSSCLVSSLESASFAPVWKCAAADGLKTAQSDPVIAAILLDTVLADADALQTLRSLVATGHGAPVLVTVRAEDEEAASDFLRAGAADYLNADASPFRLKTSIGKARDSARPANPAAPPPFHFSRAHPELAKCQDRAKAAVRHTHPVLIEGSAGTGKKRLADWIARQARKGGKVQALCCRTGAVGASELADALRRAAGGTLIIGEVGNLPADAQKLLVQRINGPARIIATSRTRLVELAAAGHCDPTLFAGFNVATIHVPALAHTPDLIGPLAISMIRAYAEQMGRPGICLAPGALDLLSALPWPDNRRQLAGLLARAIALTPEREIPTDLLTDLAGREASAVAAAPVGPFPQKTRPLADLEREAITRALGAASGRIETAARLLGLGRSTLYRKVRHYGLQDTSKAA